MLLDTPACDFGWTAPEFSLSDPDGATYSMTDHLGDRGLLIMFICNHCPYVQAIADRLVTDTTPLIEEGIGVMAVMSNDYRAVPDDAPAEMRKFAQHYGFPFPYLIDEDQAVGKAYKAVCTPDFFGFSADGALQYRGRLDDASLRQSADRKPELMNAMRMIADTGKGPSDQWPSMGCSIKWR